MLTELFTSIADAIRGKKGTTDKIKAEDFATEITNLPSGGGGGDEELVNSFKSAIDDTLGANCTKLPDGITSIGNYALERRTKLALTELPSTVTSIGNYSFASCVNLKISLPDGLLKIGENAFSFCSNWILDALPSGLISIGATAFQYCSKLAITKIPDSVTSVGASAFANCTSLISIELPNSMLTIPNSLFMYCSGLKSVNMQNTQVIGNSAFFYCTGFETLELPSSIKELQMSCFSNCSNLTEVVCNSTALTIGAQVFNNCTKLEKLVFSNITSVPTLSSVNAFTNTPIASGTGYIYVPDDLVESFKTASNWNTYANQIKGLSEL